MKLKYLTLVLLLPIIFVSCDKKGNVDIKKYGFWINNCSPAYEVKFYLDVAYQPSEVSYLWDFGDGKTTTEKEPVHLYTEPGKYTVNVTVKNYKTVVEKSLIVDVSKNPMPLELDFSYEIPQENNYAPCKVNFFNNSQYTTNFLWEFGDQTTSSKVEPEHIFEKEGNYQVTLKGICGDTTSKSSNIKILPPPNKIILEEVRVWLPDEFLNGVFGLEYALGGMNETPINLTSQHANPFPIGWFINKKLFFFSGDYNSDKLLFKINNLQNYNQTVYTFSISMHDIQTNGYPKKLVWDDNNGFAAEVIVTYGE